MSLLVFRLLKEISLTLAMVMLITCVVLRRLTDEVGVFHPETNSMFFSLPFLEQKGKVNFNLHDNFNSHDIIHSMCS